MFLILIQTYPSKGVQNILCHRHFDNNLHNIFRANILQNGTGQILLIAVLMAGLWHKFQMEIVDMIPYLLVFHPYISLLKF